jgi:NitT/TauT family transport system ATP-binding protein
MNVGVRTVGAVPHVTLRGVSKIYPARGKNAAVHALGPVDLDLTRGEFFSIVGPSGCGKSTILDLLSGLGGPSEGEIRCNGMDVGGKVPAGVGVVFQDDASFPWLTVRENASFGLRHNGTDPAVIKERVDYFLNFVGLAKFADAMPAQLSGGMRQRLCIVRTLVMKPDLIILDEPFGALDQQTRFLMGDELLRIWRETNATIVLVTHSLDEAAILSDRIGVMSARPGRFLRFINTEWERERDSRNASTPRFGQITSELWSVLREESIKSMGRVEAR